jgi:hypothetical protein
MSEQKSPARAGGAIDLSALDTGVSCDAPSTLEVLHPATEEPTGVQIDLLGTDSAVARQMRREFSRTRLKQLGRKGKLELTPEQVEREQVELLAALTTGWRNLSWKGEPLEFSRANARMLYEALPWLRDQVQEHVGDLGAYLGNSGGASAPLSVIT